MEKLTQIIIALRQLPRIGDKTIKKLLDNVEEIEELNYHELIPQFTPPFEKLLEKNQLDIHIWEDVLQKANKIIEKSRLQGITILNYKDENYPLNLKVLENFPLILNIKGNIKLLNAEKLVAVIGTREPTIFGEKMDKRCTEIFVEHDYVIVSGLAKGSDAIAHQTALNQNGKTIAVLAHGLDIPIYPKENRPLAEDILMNNGTLISTYTIGTKLRPYYLVERDEWQSGLSDGVLAIETSLTGGTNHAINQSFKQYRPLAMLDHKRFPKYSLLEKEFVKFEGNKKYISENKAMPVYELEDVMQFMEIMETGKGLRSEKFIKYQKKKENKKTTNNKTEVSQYNLFDEE